MPWIMPDELSAKPISSSVGGIQDLMGTAMSWAMEAMASVRGESDRRVFRSKNIQSWGSRALTRAACSMDRSRLPPLVS